jgi:methyl-accepting chemotaxis protein
MMISHWTVGQKLAAGFAIAALTLLVVAVLGYKSTVHLIENDHLVSHTHEVRTTIADLESLMKDAETGQRGYVITGDEAYLQPYTDALAGIEKTFDHLRALTSDNEQQQRRLDSARPLIDAKMAELKRTIGVRRSKGLEATEKLVAAGEGKSAMDQLRRVLGDMDNQELELLGLRSSEAESSVQATKEAILWGSLLGTLFIVLVGWLISSSLSSQVGAAIGHIQSSSSELQSAASQQATGAREQSTSMAEISTTISELLATSRQIAESSQRVAHIASETAQAAGKGDQTVLKAQDSIAAIRRQVDLIVGHMLELGKKSQQIGGILEIINELAEQTNILSINASIEAAGSGEAGRRFAVVADEIRKLADRVGGSTKEIRTLIEEVRAAVNTTVMATEGGAKAAETGTRQFADVASAFQSIVSLVGTSTEAAREIELSTKQQSTAVEQVNVAISNVAQATRETEASSSQTLQTAVELSSLSRDLSKLIHASASAA